MPGFDHSILTNVGWDALADALAGKRLAFVHMEAGNGDITGGDAQMMTMTQLVHKTMDVPITSFSDDGQGQVTLIGTLSSKNNPGVAFYFKELGVKATIDGGAELLYAVSSAGTGATTGDYIPASTEPSTVIQTIEIVVKIDRTITPTINIVAGGDVTAQNIGPGTAGAGLFRDKIGQVLNFKRIMSQTGLIQWTDLGDRISLDLGIPAGVIWEWGGSIPPTGWLLCDGAIRKRSDYPALYQAIGTTFGAGDGSTTFGIPDCRGRVTLGAGQGAGLTNRVLGGMGGEENHILTVAEMPIHSHSATQPAHNHGVNDPTHAHSVYDPTHAHSIADPGHQHSYIYGNTSYQNQPGLGASSTMVPPWFNNFSGWVGAAATNIGIYGAATGVAIYGAATNISIQYAQPGITVSNAGGGTSHNTMQPFLVINKIIKF
jgi:microcystin-dependent protein